MRRVADQTPPSNLAEGQWCWTFRTGQERRETPWRGLAYRLPGWPGARRINVWDQRTGKPAPNDCWLWDGDEDAPTVSPSIKHLDPLPDGGWEVLWHGNVRAGQWKAA